MVDFEFTLEKVEAMLVGNKQASYWFPVLAELLPANDISTVLRVAAFMAQTCHESANYTRLHENLNYRAESLVRTWPTRFTLATAERYAHKPEAIANLVYANRLGNGDEASGDGWRYRGRGPIQITGKANYETLSITLYGDDRLLYTPEVLEEDFGMAVKSACWFWDRAGLSPLADVQDIKTMTKKINGGYIGLAERQEKFEQNLEILRG